MLACFQIWNIGHISVSVLAARHDSSSAPTANSRRKEWQLAWRCCCRCQPTATTSPACAPPTLLADPGCVPCKCSIVGAGRVQELLFKCSKCPVVGLPLLGCTHVECQACLTRMESSGPSGSMI
ncbi:uncharacterized protein [Miscanthus floridulus]|uniref:uncharacterized protein isoform X2 n=1 Tax=Miscanthus floridulus TaxID=154761 RepID=UPI00345839AD